TSMSEEQPDLGLGGETEKKKDPSRDFHLVEKLGEGYITIFYTFGQFLIPTLRSYGSVWKAIHVKTETITAIKKVPVENDLDEILNEIKIMKACRSPYIISYYGSYLRDNELWVRRLLLQDH